MELVTTLDKLSITCVRRFITAPMLARASLILFMEASRLARTAVAPAAVLMETLGFVAPASFVIEPVIGPLLPKSAKSILITCPALAPIWKVNRPTRGADISNPDGPPYVPATNPNAPKLEAALEPLAPALTSIFPLGGGGGVGEPAIEAGNGKGAGGMVENMLTPPK